jgi:hypothetical protein
MGSRLFLICLAVLLVAQTPVYAYTDPGSGTLILQMLLAASFGIMFYLRRIVRWFRGLRARRDEATTKKDYSEKESGSAQGDII